MSPSSPISISPTLFVDLILPAFFALGKTLIAIGHRELINGVRGFIRQKGFQGWMEYIDPFRIPLP